jgi:ubiquitin-like 1-activating enzyme E1 B
VGVGGIGCEVLKNLSKFPIKKIVIIDLDVIELSNLNRQFYFRKEYLQQSKAKVAKLELLKLVPDLNIEAI